jgi:hypothetical protein
VEGGEVRGDGEGMIKGRGAAVFDNFAKYVNYFIFLILEIPLSPLPGPKIK